MKGIYGAINKKSFNTGGITIMTVSQNITIVIATLLLQYLLLASLFFQFISLFVNKSSRSINVFFSFCAASYTYQCSLTHNSFGPSCVFYLYDTIINTFNIYIYIYIFASSTSIFNPCFQFNLCT